jgi:S1-C subfamily serine protease
MRGWIGASVFALGFAAATTAWAGSYEKCTMSTQDCLNAMAETMRTAGWVGVEIDKDAKGTVTVKRVFPDSPAQAAGIEAGDIFYALNGVVLSNASKDELAKARKDWKPGQNVTYTIKRNGADRQVQVTLAPVPADVMARWIGEHLIQHASAMDVAKQEPAKN